MNTDAESVKAAQLSERRLIQMEPRRHYGTTEEGMVLIFINLPHFLHPCQSVFICGSLASFGPIAPNGWQHARRRDGRGRSHSR